MKKAVRFDVDGREMSYLIKRTLLGVENAIFFGVDHVYEVEECNLLVVVI